MSLLYQWVDENDSKVWFDMNDPTGANNLAAFGIGLPTFAWGVDIGETPIERRLFETDADGAEVVGRRLREARTSWLQGWNGNTAGLTADQARTALGVLQELLTGDRGGMIKYRGSETSALRYIIPSGADGISTQLRGQDGGVVKHFSQIIEPGMPLAIARRPKLRGERIIALTQNILSNPFLLHQGATANRPRGWAWDTISVTAEDLDDGYEFEIATALIRMLQQTSGAASAAPGDVWTFGFLAWAESGADVRARARIEFLSAASAVLATHDGGSLTTLRNNPPDLGDPAQAIQVTTPAAPASTDRIRVSIRFENAAATNRRVHLLGAQLRKASSLGLLSGGRERVVNDPTSTGAYGRVMPVLIQGDAPPDDVEIKITQRAGSQMNSALLAHYDASRRKRSLEPIVNRGLFFQAEAFPNLLLGTALVTMVNGWPNGGANNGINISFSGGAAMATRAQNGQLAIPPGLKGTFWIYGRIRASAVGADFTLRLDRAFTSGGKFSESDIRIVATDVDARDVRLGKIEIPEDYDPATLFFDLGASRVSGTVDVDALFLVPTDAVAFFDPSIATMSADTILYARTERRSAMVSSTGLVTELDPPIKGPLPDFSPGWHGLYLAHGRGDAADRVTDFDSADQTIEVDVEVSYWPGFYA